MATSKRGATDPNQFDFKALLSAATGQAPIALPQPVELPAVKDPQAELKRQLADDIKASPFSREDIAERLTGLTGQRFTKTMIDAWTRTSAPHNAPAWILPFWSQAVGSRAIVARHAELSGLVVAESDQLRMAKYGQLAIVMAHLMQQVTSDLPLFGSRRHG